MPLLAAVALLWPLHKVFWWETHDHAAYVVRAMEYVRMWRSGAPFPRWCLDLYGGFGAPLFNFYPPGLFAVTGLWILAGAAAPVALKISVVFFSLVGTLGVYGLVLGECERRDAAFVGAFAFVTMPYRFVCIFARGDLAELSAMALVPYAVWAYRAISRSDDKRLALVGYAAALLQAAVLFTHTLTGQWSTELIALYAIGAVLVAARARRWDRVRVIVLAQAGAAAVSAIYAVPALVERNMVHIERMTGGYFATVSHLVPWSLFFRFRYFDFATDGTLAQAHRMPLTVGIPLCAAALMALGCLVVPRSRRALVAAAPWWLTTLALLALMTPHAAFLWRHLPFAEFTQFPWRLLEFVVVFGAAAVGLTWAAALPAQTRARWPLAVVAALLMVYTVKPFLAVRPSERWRVPTTIAEIRGSIQSTVVSDEYLPRLVPSAPSIPQGGELVELGPEGATLEGWWPYRTGYRIALTAYSDTEVLLRQFWFPGWRVRGDNRVQLQPTSEGLIKLVIPAAGHYQLTVEFGTTPLRGAVTALSVLTLLFLYPLMRRASRSTVRR